jgi:WD40 repeat protein
VSAPVNCVCLHPNQAELVVGDQSGVIHLWDLKTDHNEQLVRSCVHNVSISPQEFSVLMKILVLLIHIYCALDQWQ